MSFPSSWQYANTTLPIYTCSTNTIHDIKSNLEKNNNWHFSPVFASDCVIEKDQKLIFAVDDIEIVAAEKLLLLSYAYLHSKVLYKLATKNCTGKYFGN